MTLIIPEASQLPRELVESIEWLGFQFVPKKNNPDEIEKIPCDPLTKIANGWQAVGVSFDDARRGAIDNKLDAIGINPRKTSGRVFVDIDGCIRDGNLDPMVEGFLRALPGYWEITPSGTGLRGIMHGTLSRNVLKTAIPRAAGFGTVNTEFDSSIELYDGSSNHPVTVTGNRFREAPLELQNNEEGIKLVLRWIKFDVDEKPFESHPLKKETAQKIHEKNLQELRSATRDERWKKLYKVAAFAAQAFAAKAIDADVRPEIWKALCDEFKSVGQHYQPDNRYQRTMEDAWRDGLHEPLEIIGTKKAHDPALARIDALLADNAATFSLESVVADAACLTSLEYEAKRVELAKRIKIRATKLDEEVAKRHSTLKEEPEEESAPTPPSWHESVPGDALGNEIAEFFESYVDFKHTTDPYVMTVWAIGTHLFDSFDIFPRLGFSAPEPECAKTLCLELLGLLCRDFVIAANLSVAVAFRIMQRRPTLGLDELDTYLEKYPELIGVLNSGHRKNGFVYRMEKIDEQQEIMKFPTFAPCCYAMIGKPTEAFLSRTIMINLHKKLSGVVKEDYEESEALSKEIDILRRKIRRWVTDNRGAVAACKPDLATLRNRQRDNWKPMIKIASVMGQEWANRMLNAAGLVPKRDKATDRQKLLADIKEIFAEQEVDRMPSELLIQHLVFEKHEHNWYRYHHHNENQPLDQSDLADLLEAYEIRPKNIRLNKQLQLAFYPTDKEKDRPGTKKGYLLEHFTPVFERYLAEAQDEAA